MKFLSFLPALLVASFVVPAHAEVVTYKGLVNGKPLVLTLAAQLPAAIKKTVMPPYNDPELGAVDEQTSYDATLGLATLTVGEKTSTAPFYAVGEVHVTGVGFQVIAFFPNAELAGFDFDGTILNGASAPTIVNPAKSEISKILYPSQFSVRWFIHADHPTDGARNGIVTLIKQ